MIKSEIEKEILSQNINRFKNHITIAPINMLIKIIPFLCAWGNLSMLNMLELKLPKPIHTLQNKDVFMRMSLLSNNFEIVNYLNDKKCMEHNQMIRYYVCSGGNNDQIYSIMNNSWIYVKPEDIKIGIKNGDIKTIQYLSSKLELPIDNYSHLSIDKQKELLKNNNIFNYYYNNNINNDLIIQILYDRKIKNIQFIQKIVTLKIFFRKIKNKFYIIK
jgi:hypothetical protein